MIDPDVAANTARRLAAKMVADQAEECIASLVGQFEGETLSVTGDGHGLVLVARGRAAERVLEFLLEGGISSAEKVYPT